MTVCIGALCTDRNGTPAKAAVVASDRMVTLGGLIEFEHEVPKVASISDTVVGLMAGDAIRGSQLARSVAVQVAAAGLTVEQIAEATGKRYAAARIEQIQAEVFAPRGMNIVDFYQSDQQGKLLSQLVGMLDGQVAAFDFGVQMLVVGTDDGGAHLYFIGNPGGTASNFAQIGYHAIGSGAIHALQSMISLGHMGGRSLNETVFNVYASKRRAEVAPGVGKDTDLGIICDGRFTRIEALAELEEVYQEYQRPVSNELKERVNGLSLMKEPTQ